MFRKIIVPLDGSKESEKALPYAESLAEQYDGELILIWGLEATPPVVVADYATIPAPPIAPQERQHANQYLNELRESLRERNIRARTMLLERPSVAEAIVEKAIQEKADVIVKSTYGRSGISRWVFGNVALQVLQQASCPVLLIRASEEQAS